MRRSVGWGILLVAGLPLILWGCLDSKTVLTVNTDGSGTIEQTLYVKSDKEEKGAKEKGPEEVRAECAKTAETMGEGVAVKSVTPLEPRGQWKGFKITYAFTDITKVKVGFLPPLAASMKTADKDLLRFEFQGGAQPKLTIVRPALNMGDQKEEEEKEPPAEMLAAFEGARVEFEVRVNGTITSTNASLVNAEKTGLTLLKEDIGGLLRDKAAMAALKALAKLKDPKEIRDKLQDAAVKKYVQMEPEERVTIEFK